MTNWPDGWKLQIPATLEPFARVLLESEELLSDGYGYYCDFDDFIVILKKFAEASRG